MIRVGAWAKNQKNAPARWFVHARGDQAYRAVPEHRAAVVPALEAEPRRAVRERRTVKRLFGQMPALGDPGSDARVTRGVRAWR